VPSVVFTVSHPRRCPLLSSFFLFVWLLLSWVLFVPWVPPQSSFPEFVGMTFPDVPPIAAAAAAAPSPETTNPATTSRGSTSQRSPSTTTTTTATANRATTAVTARASPPTVKPPRNSSSRAVSAPIGIPGAKKNVRSTGKSEDSGRKIGAYSPEARRLRVLRCVVPVCVCVCVYAWLGCRGLVGVAGGCGLRVVGLWLLTDCMAAPLQLLGKAQEACVDEESQIRRAQELRRLEAACEGSLCEEGGRGTAARVDSDDMSHAALPALPTKTG